MAVLDQKDLISEALRLSTDGIIIVDAEGVVIFWNQGAHRILDIPSEEVVHKNLSGISVESMIPGGDFSSIMKKAVKKNKPVNLTTAVRNSHISHLTLAINATPVPTSENEKKRHACVFTFKDVSDFKTQETEMEKKLNFLEGYVSKIKETQMASMNLMKETVFQKREIKELNSQLQKLNKNITAALEEISHEILSPLANIVGFCNLITDADDIKREEINDYVASMLQSSGRIQSMAQRLLDEAKMESGMVSDSEAVNFKEIDINKIIKDTIKEHEMALSQKKHAIHINLKKGRMKMDGDPELITQIVDNLLSNAIKYTPKKGKISIETQKEGEFVRMRFSDTGIGIPEKEIPHIFERFHRIRDPKGGNNVGAGIGLSLVKAIVTLHNGTIEVESHPGKGSVFEVLLPKTRPEIGIEI